MFWKIFEILQILLLYLVLFPFTVFSTVYFQEEFSDGDKWQERWVLSEHPSRQLGFFILSAGKFYGHSEMSKGIQTFQNGMHYGISTKFTSFSNKGKSLVIQFTVKHEENIKCGGGYIKIFNCSLNSTELNEKTPYLIMFGPDKCIPKVFKVQAILNYKGKYYDIQKDIIYKDDIYTHLYTLIINPDNTYMIKIDNVDVESGNLRKDWELLPPETILDVKAKKPLDWEDNAIIDDPDDQKPDDYDQPEYIPDPTITKPSDWDHYIDGEWEPPLIENLDFKGTWKPQRIPNPKYKGPWVRPRKKNPEHVPDFELYKFDEICGVGFEFWQVQSGTIFDNILITDDADYAEEHGWKTWGTLKDSEKKMAKLIYSQKAEKMHMHDEL